MKILIATDTYKPTINGVVTSIINLQSGLQTLGHEVRILTLSSTDQSYIDSDIYYIGAYDVSELYPDAKIKIKQGKKELIHILNWKPDIIHTQSEFNTFLLAKQIAKKLSIPIIHTYHTMYEDYTHYFSPNKKMGKKAVTAITNHVANHVSAMVAPTNKIYNVLTTYGVDCPIEVIPSGISLEKFETNIPQQEIINLKTQLNLPQDNLILLSVSRIGKEKNIDELIGYMKSLRDKKISLVIVGDGPYKEELEDLVSLYDLEDNIKFTGMITPQQVPVYYQMADLFVSASTSETQGLTYIEALASGTPILCRKDDCLDGVLLEGKNGYSFEDKTEFLAKLDNFITRKDKEDMMIEAKTTVGAYSKAIFTDNIATLYQRYTKSDERCDGLGSPLKCNTQQKKYTMIVSSLILAGSTIYGYSFIKNRKSGI
ncbi:MAG: hypothetical protein BEN18_03900 [Epulopiscium sp. Nuni2H_MBin001]|nr:MAG: hypothetical protein BEN18_03900 [Epulopiscium sp. Nuni2H_MBin001]